MIAGVCIFDTIAASLSNILLELQLVDLCGTRETYRIERYRVKECLVLQNTHIGYQIKIK